jgi:GTPase SAR1 family protein
MHRPAVAKRRLFQLGFAEQSNHGVVYSSASFHDLRALKGKQGRKALNIAVIGAANSGKSRFIHALSFMGEKRKKDDGISDPGSSSPIPSPVVTAQLTGYELHYIPTCLSFIRVREIDGIFLVASELSAEAAYNCWPSELADPGPANTAKSSSSRSRSLKGGVTSSAESTPACCTRFDVAVLLFDSASEDSFEVARRLEDRLPASLPRCYVATTSSAVIAG